TLYQLATTQGEVKTNGAHKKRARQGGVIKGQMFAGGFRGGYKAGIHGGQSGCISDI
ncbi:hypothetical protein DFH28DRAFT_889604, partial [Melampsora americana]